MKISETMSPQATNLIIAVLFMSCINACEEKASNSSSKVGTISTKSSNNSVNFTSPYGTSTPLLTTKSSPSQNHASKPLNQVLTVTSSGLSGTSTKTDETTPVIAEKVAPSSKKITNDSTGDKQQTFTIPCNKTFSPPINDQSKIANMLINSGKITDNMTKTEKQAVIKRYISTKQKNVIDCNKTKGKH